MPIQEMYKKSLELGLPSDYTSTVHRDYTLLQNNKSLISYVSVRGDL